MAQLVANECSCNTFLKILISFFKNGFYSICLILKVVENSEHFCFLSYEVIVNSRFNNGNITSKGCCLVI